MKTTVNVKRIKKILARTDWSSYWVEVSRDVETEVRAYDEARRKSLERATEKCLR